IHLKYLEPLPLKLFRVLIRECIFSWFDFLIMFRSIFSVKGNYLLPPPPDERPPPPDEPPEERLPPILLPLPYDEFRFEPELEFMVLFWLESVFRLLLLIVPLVFGV